jgi:hypothetical protein
MIQRLGQVPTTLYCSENFTEWASQRTEQQPRSMARQVPEVFGIFQPQASGRKMVNHVIQLGRSVDSPHVARRRAIIKARSEGSIQSSRLTYPVPFYLYQIRVGYSSRPLLAPQALTSAKQGCAFMQGAVLITVTLDNTTLII